VLKGALDDFALTDIFRLISLAKKTGRLEVLRQAGHGAVFFGEGDVLFAESSLVREPLGQKLIRAGALTEGQLRRALDEHAETGLRLGQVLLSAGWVSEKDLEDAVRGQTEDAVFDLLRWEVGEFTWASGERVEAEVPVAVSVENLIMEASRRLDEMDIITRKIPSVDAVMAMAAKPPEGAVEINITPDEWRLLVLVNGSRSVATIAETVGVDDFDALKTLYGMLSAGLVEVVSPGRDATTATPEGIGESRTEAPTPPATVEPEPDVEAGPEVVPEPGPAVAIEPVTEPGARVEGEMAPAEDPFAPEVDVATPEADVAANGGTWPDVPAGPASQAVSTESYDQEVAAVPPPRGFDVGVDAEPELEVTSVDDDVAAGPPQPAAPETPAEESEPEPSRPQAWSEEGEPEASVPDAWTREAEPEPAVPPAWAEEGAWPSSGSSEGWTAEAEPEPAPAGVEVEEESPLGDLQGAVVDPAEAQEPRAEALGDEPLPRPADETAPVDEIGPVPGPVDEAEPDLRPVDPDALEEAEPEVGAGPEPESNENDVSEAPRLERSAAVRELAGLWGDPDQPGRRPASQRPADPAPVPDARKRVEDDEDIDRGVISKLIDGVKGL
jgi:hypothetical protein